MYCRIVKRYKIYIKTFLPKDSHDYKETNGGCLFSLGTFRSQIIMYRVGVHYRYIYIINNCNLMEKCLGTFSCFAPGRLSS